MTQRSIEWGEREGERGETAVQIFSESCTFQRVAIEIWFPSALLSSLWSPQGSHVQRLQVSSCHFWSASLLLKCRWEATCLPRLPNSMPAPPPRLPNSMPAPPSSSHPVPDHTPTGPPATKSSQCRKTQEEFVFVDYNNPISHDLQHTWVFTSALTVHTGQRGLLLFCLLFHLCFFPTCEG